MFKKIKSNFEIKIDIKVWHFIWWTLNLFQNNNPFYHALQRFNYSINWTYDIPLSR